MNDANQDRCPAECVLDADAVLRALRRAVAEARRMHKLLGNPISESRDGRVVWIAPEDIDP